MSYRLRFWDPPTQRDHEFQFHESGGIDGRMVGAVFGEVNSLHNNLRT